MTLGFYSFSSVAKSKNCVSTQQRETSSFPSSM